MFHVKHLFKKICESESSIIIMNKRGKNMQIRNMTLDDYNGVDRLMVQVHQLHVKGRPDLYIDVDHIYSLNDFQKMVENQDIITVLAEKEGVVVGICMVSMRAKTCMVKRRTAYMEDLCIDESYRGKGIGRELFLYVKEKAKEMGAERLDLMVWEFNESAKRFYEEMGMKPQRYIFETKL